MHFLNFIFMATLHIDSRKWAALPRTPLPYKCLQVIEHSWVSTQSCSPIARVILHTRLLLPRFNYTYVGPSASLSPANNPQPRRSAEGLQLRQRCPFPSILSLPFSREQEQALRIITLTAPPGCLCSSLSFFARLLTLIMTVCCSCRRV